MEVVRLTQIYICLHQETEPATVKSYVLHINLFSVPTAHACKNLASALYSSHALQNYLIDVSIEHVQKMKMGVLIRSVAQAKIQLCVLMEIV